MIEFKEYLTEGIGPIKTDYGTNDNVDDGKLIDGDHTYFNHDHIRYEVAVFVDEGMGEVTFGAAGMGFQRTGLGQTSKILGKVMYVASEIAKKAKVRTIYFSGYDAGLQKLYARMVNNKTFIAAVEKLGFDVALEHGHFLMRKKAR